MRRFTRAFGTLLIVAGVATLGWAALVWAWQDPFTSLYTRWQQHRLAQDYALLSDQFRPAESTISLAAARRELRADAKRFRRLARRSQAIGRISVPRMGIHMLLVNGTDHESLKKGPGRDLRSHMPGEGELVYVAGHRTTYLAPFSHIDAMQKGDRITVTMPYATFTYAVTGHRIVVATDMSVLRSHGREVLELQACHPRFFSSHRYIVFAKLVSVELRGAKSVSATALAAAAQS